MGLVQFDTFCNVIDGGLSTTEATRNGINPATLEPLPPVPVCTVNDVELAVKAASRAALSWARVPLNVRQQKVIEFADALAGQAEDFARMLTLEQGKPLQVAIDEVTTAAGMLKGVAQLPFPEDVIEETEHRRVVTRYVPIGVSVGIVPWNFPITLATFKLGPALVAGSPIIMKPSPFTPYSGLKLVELAQNFFPPGVVQALSGDDSLGPWLTSAAGVRKVSFTGSTPTGIKVMQSCANGLKRVTLELGGNDPAVVCSSVNIKEVAPKIVGMAFYNSGQVCIAIKRVYVHSSIYEEFLAAMSSYADSLAVGDGMKASTTLGPIQNSMQYIKLQSLVQSVRSEGLQIASGNPETAFANKQGYFMQPLIIDNPPDNSNVVVEEQFGPVLPVMRWDSEGEVIQRANNTSTGLGASVWSTDLAQANRIGKQLQAGNIWINSHLELQPNAPFGGSKDSGIGSELGVEGLKSYCNTQTWYENK